MAAYEHDTGRYFLPPLRPTGVYAAYWAASGRLPPARSTWDRMPTGRVPPAELWVGRDWPSWCVDVLVSVS